MPHPSATRPLNGVSQRWLCVSTMPGIRIMPVASMTSAPVRSSLAPTFLMTSPSTSTSVLATSPTPALHETTKALANSVLDMGISSLRRLDWH